MKFTNWLIDNHIFEWINCGSQIIIAIAAAIALYLTCRQFSGKAKVKLKAKTEFRISERKNHTFYVEIILHIVNLGMAPVYISESGIQLWDEKKEKWPMCISLEPIVIKPGDIAHISGEYDCEMMDDHATLQDEVSVYAKCQLDRCWFEKARISYADLKHDCDKVRRNLPH